MGNRWVYTSIVSLLFISAFFTFPVYAVDSYLSMMTTDADLLELVATITLDGEPMGIAVNEETNLVYVSTEEGLTVIDGETDEIVTEIPLLGGALVLAADPKTNRIYAAAYENDHVCVKVIDGATNHVVGEIPESPSPWEFAVNPLTNLIYIADRSITMGLPDCVHVYDGETFERLTSIEIPGSREVTTIRNIGVAVNPKTNLVYVAWNYKSSVFLIDGDSNEIIESTSTPPWDTYQVTVNPYTNYVYVEFGGVVLDGETIENVTSDYEGSILAVDSIHNLVYTKGYNKLYVLDGDTHKVGDELHAEYLVDAAVNPKTGKVYLTQRDVLEHESVKKVSVVQGPISPLSLPEFVFSDMILEQEVEVGETSTVTVKVTNIGDLEGSPVIEVKIDGTVEDTTTINLAGGESKTVAFKVSKEKPGAYEVEIDGQRGTLMVKKKGCIIATATYGSELSPEVQFLRGFRDQKVVSTFAGSHFMKAFNNWYYSFSPSVAGFIAGQLVIKTIMKGVLYPLIGILHLSSVTYSAFAFSPELSIVMAGLVASSFIGMVYLSPLIVVILVIIKRLRKSILMAGRLRIHAIPWLTSVILVLLGEIYALPAIMRLSTTLFVLTTLASSATIVATKVVQHLLYNKT